MNRSIYYGLPLAALLVAATLLSTPATALAQRAGTVHHGTAYHGANYHAGYHYGVPYRGAYYYSNRAYPYRPNYGWGYAYYRPNYGWGYGYYGARVSGGRYPGYAYYPYVVPYPQVYTYTYVPLVTPYVVPPATYNAFYSPASATPVAPANDTAQVTVYVPAATAEVWFGDTAVQTTGTARQFVSPPLVPGRTFTYHVTARWTVDGQQVMQSRDVAVRAGDRVTVDFTRPASP
jgi:uncharacterized protein (TIGR03000 family)